MEQINFYCVVENEVKWYTITKTKTAQFLKLKQLSAPKGKIKKFIICVVECFVDMLPLRLASFCTCNSYLIANISTERYSTDHIKITQKLESEIL